MHGMLILMSIVFIILTKALIDGFSYLSRYGGKPIHGYLHHSIEQFIFIPGIFLFGFYFKYDIFQLKTIWLIIGYALMNTGLFDMFLFMVCGIDKRGTTDLIDILLSKIPFINSPIARLITAFIGACLILKTY